MFNKHRKTRNKRKKKINDKLTSYYTVINVEKRKKTLITVNKPLIDSLIEGSINIEDTKETNINDTSLTFVFKNYG